MSPYRSLSCESRESDFHCRCGDQCVHTCRHRHTHTIIAPHTSTQCHGDNSWTVVVFSFFSFLSLSLCLCLSLSVAPPIASWCSSIQHPVLSSSSLSSHPCCCYLLTPFPPRLPPSHRRQHYNHFENCNGKRG